MTDAESIPWLLILFRPQLTLAWMPTDIGRTFVLDGAVYAAETESDLTGFFDRIYSRGDGFAGIQFTPAVLKEVPRHVSGFRYVRSVERDQRLQIFLFGEPPRYVEIVPDEAFGGRVYRTAGGEFATSLDTYFLTREERERLAQSSAVWVDVVPF